MNDYEKELAIHDWIAGFYGCSGMKILNFGAAKEFVNHVTVGDQYERYHLTAEKIISDVLKELMN